MSIQILTHILSESVPELLKVKEAPGIIPVFIFKASPDETDLKLI